MLQTISIIVSGKVQGVFFRQSTREKATQLGVTGFIKNQPDKTVYILATGVKEQLDELVAWCRVGPPQAQVSNVLVQPEPLQAFARFSIWRF
ncbi:MAG: acylphosphatase [Bacteroidota bacterium]